MNNNNNNNYDSNHNDGYKSTKQHLMVCKFLLHIFRVSKSIIIIQ